MMQQSVLSHAVGVFDSLEEICERYNPSGLLPIRKMVAQKRSSPEASVMVYGVYNAGKSTLINALLGESRAKVADKPETDRVSSYRWREFEILDTPGIDAPISHEQVTREQLYSADAVIFVVNPLGVLEEAETLATLLDLVERNKKVVLVLNCKNPLDPMDAERLKDALRQRFQEKAKQAGLNQVVQAIPILEVNARAALKAKLEGKDGLLARSGLPRLEQGLYAFLKSIGEAEIAASFVSELVGFIEETRGLLDRQTDSTAIAQVDVFYAEIAHREAALRASLKALTDAKSAFIEKRTFSIVSSSPETAQAEISDLLQRSSNEVFGELESELRRLAADASILLDEMLEDIRVEGEVHTPEAALDVGSEDGDTSVLVRSKSGIDFQMLQTGVHQIGTVIKPEHIVSVLKVGKDLLPSLFKGIGPVTMGKIGEQIVGKVVPAIGIAIQAAQVLYSLFSGDPEEARIREEARLRQEQEERRDQAIRDMGETVAWEFRTSVMKTVDDHIRDSFAEVNERLKVIRSSFTETQRKLSEDRAVLVEGLAALQAGV